MRNEMSIGPIIEELAHKIETNDFVIDKSGVKTVELIAPRLELDPEKMVLEFGDIRKTPEKYVQAELEWYLSKDLKVTEIAKHAKIWNEVASDFGDVNSNYGWCIFSEENYNQYSNVYQELIRNPESRRAVMIYNRPKMWYDYCRDGMSDFMCTFATQHMIRDNGYGPRLISVVNMRSNDLIFGFFNDFYWQAWVHNHLLERLQIVMPKLKSGRMIWLANSLHVYERHFDMLLKMRDWYRKERKEMLERTFGSGEHTTDD